MTEMTKMDAAAILRKHLEVPVRISCGRWCRCSLRR